MTKNIIETIGCDLGDKKSEICVLDADGNVKQRVSVRTTRKSLGEWFNRAVAHVVIEVGTHSRWVIDCGSPARCTSPWAITSDRWKRKDGRPEPWKSTAV